jgi:hypothetical protein
VGGVFTSNEPAKIVMVLGILALFLGFVLILEYIALYLAQIALFFAAEVDRVCTRYFNPPSKSIYTMLDTKDITNLVDECPCMQQ